MNVQAIVKQKKFCSGRVEGEMNTNSDNVYIDIMNLTGTT